MPPAGFEPIIPGSERPHTDALDRTAMIVTTTKFTKKKLMKEVRDLGFRNRLVQAVQFLKN